MPYKDNDRRREYQRAWVRKNRQSWISNNGPCAACGSLENLEVDHIDRTKKETHKVWSWSKKRRDRELNKCQVLCETCHKEKTAKETSKLPKGGKRWCWNCKLYVDESRFNRHRGRKDGWSDECTPCTVIRKREWRQRQKKKGIPVV